MYYIRSPKWRGWFVVVLANGEFNSSLPSHVGATSFLTMESAILALVKNCKGGNLSLNDYEIVKVVHTPTYQVVF